MSTRATYCFKSTQEHIPTITFYIHYDGYCEGGAEYFYNMLACSNQRGGNSDKFHRGNDLAEITKNHNSHGDTEYRYDIENEALKVFNITDWDKRDVQEGWECVYEGTIIDFIKKYKPDHDLTVVNYYGKSIELPFEVARGYLKNSYDYIDCWVDDGKFIGNLSSSYDICRKNIHLFTDSEKVRLEKCRVLCSEHYPHTVEYKIPIKGAEALALSE